MIQPTEMKTHQWTLFLDRDGVINKRLVGDYVKEWSEFEFLPGVLDALCILSDYFNHICIVTNQQGIAKKLMTEKDLTEIHAAMQAVIEARGGRVDAIYYCPHAHDTGCECRKPGQGMIQKAQKQFPQIDLARSIMVGDSITDIEMGLRAGMHTVFITTSSPDVPDHVDNAFDSLYAFAQYVVDA